MKTIARITSLLLIVAMCAVMLVSCAPNSDPKKATEALKDAGYIAGDAKIVSAALSLALKAAGIDSEITDVVMGSKTEKTDDKTTVDAITIVYFSDSDMAEKAEETVRKYFDGLKDQDGATFDRSGAMIYWGTDAAIKAAR